MQDTSATTPPVTLPALLRTTEAARALGVSPRTVIAWLAQGRFDGAFCTPGGHWRVPAGAVQAVRQQMWEEVTDARP